MVVLLMSSGKPDCQIWVLSKRKCLRQSAPQYFRYPELDILHTDSEFFTASFFLFLAVLWALL